MANPVPEKGERWGILGGAFDPIHNGHLVLAREIQSAQQLDGILFVLSHRPPRKNAGCVATFQQRLEMIRIAIGSDLRMTVTEIEREIAGTSYTLHVLRALKQRFPLVSFYFIIGADLLNEIESWYGADELVAETSFIAGARPHSQLVIPDWFPAGTVNIVPTTPVDISSHEIRLRIRNGISEDELGSLTPPTVARYIIENGLYT